MTTMTLCAVYAGTAAYLAAAAVTLGYLKNADQRLLATGRALAMIAALGFAVAFAARWLTWGLLPLTTVADSLLVFVLMATAIALAVARAELRPVLCFYLPPLVALALLDAAVAHAHFGAAPRQLTGPLLAVHVGLAFLAYALFFVASATSAAYLFQANRLKRHHAAGLFLRLPSLELLDRTLFTLIRWGYLFFVVTLVLGAVWTRIDGELLGAHWWLSPKIIRAAVMVAFYACAFHARRFGWLRGQKLAYLVFIGFSSLLVAYLALGLMSLSDYNFWEAAS